MSLIAAASLAFLVLALLVPHGARAAGANSGWSVTSRAAPTDFQHGEPEDSYEVALTNVGAATTSGTLSVSDTLPAQLEAKAVNSQVLGLGNSLSCAIVAASHTVECTTSEAVAPFHTIELSIAVAPTSAAPATVSNDEIAVSEDGVAEPVEVTASPNAVNLSPPARLSVEDFSFGAFQASGAAMSAAGGHPFAVVAGLTVPTAVHEAETGDLTSHLIEPVEEQDEVVVELPLGLVGDPASTPQCTLTAAVNKACPASTEVADVLYGALHSNGVSGSTQAEGGGSVTPVFNVVPEQGYPAEFSVEVAKAQVTLYAAVVDTDGRYMLRVLVPGLTRAAFTFEQLLFFGAPAAQNGGGGPLGEPFFTYAADCEAGALEAVVHVDSWQDPAAVPLNPNGSPDLNAVNFSEPQWASATASLPTPTGCGLLAPLFKPSLSVAPSGAGEEGSSQADSASAYTAQLTVPQSNDPTAATPAFDAIFDETPGTPPVRDATVTLPAGVSLSPSAASGLVGCSEADERLGSNEPSACPEASKIGSVEVTTPLLGRRNLEEGAEYGKVTGAEPIDGSVYLVQPQAADLSLNGRGPGTFRLLIELRSERYGIDIKIPGTVTAGEANGQLTASFQENPQLPFSSLKLHFHGGPRAPLANPQECGPYTTDASVSSWAREPGEAETGVASSNSFEVGGCGASLPFAPALSAGTANAAAGSSSPLTLSFSRDDGEQDLGGIAVQLPQGLLGKIAGVAKCSEAEARAIEASGTGSCAAGSEIGSAAVTAGPGADPFQINDGKVFLTGPYGGGPFGLAIVVPAVAGPFNLGEVLVRASIQVNPLTAALTVVSSPLPQIRDGVPFRLRSATVDVDRPGFVVNATSCTQRSVTATIAGEHPLGSSEAAKTSTVSTPYAASGCARLPFDPALTASTNGKTSRREGASLTVKIAYTEGEANVRRVHVQLPAKLPARDSTLEHACPEATFAANPASCPPLAVIGSAKAVTPLLNVPLEGPAYYVSHGGAAFPEIIAVLQGEGVTIDLAGETFISKKGVITSTFASVPDAPISSFELTLPQGSDSALAANNGNVCEGTLSMPTTIDGQNGAQIEQDTAVKATGCPAKKKSAAKPKVAILEAKATGKRLLLTVRTSAKGRLRLSGAGVRALTEKGLAAGTHKLTLKLNAKHAKKVKLTARLTVGEQAAVKARRVTL